MAEAASGKEMSFWDHLDELRGVLIRSAIAIVAVSLVAMCFKTFMFEKVVLAPVKDSFCIYRWLGITLGMELINIEVTAQFFIHLKVSLIAGLVICFPYIIYEIWKFIAPALYRREKAAVKKAFLMSSGLFYTGVLVGYFFVLPVCLNFFMGYTVSNDVQNTISLNSYISLFSSMVILIGIVFEFPTIIAVLSHIGIVTKAMLKKYRKHALVIMMILSAIITPSDPVSMIVLAAPLYLLYEISILTCHDRKPDEDDDDEDEVEEQ